MNDSRAADVVVVGGGAVGAATAHALARRGVSVTLLDAVTSGRATSASAGGLWALGESIGLGCGVILHAANAANAGAAGAQSPGPEPLPRAFLEFLCASNARFPALAAELRAETGVDVEAESGTGLLYLLYDEAQQRHARTILAWLRADGHGPLGADRIEEWTPETVRERTPEVTHDLCGAIHLPGDNQVNPMLLCEALKRAAVARGARFVEEARVRGFGLEHGRIVSVRTDRGDFACGAVVNAAGAWAREVARLAGTDVPVEPVRGQIVCTETLAPGTLRTNLSTRECYLLQKAHGEVIVGSTTERCAFDASVRLENVRALAAGAVRAVPALAAATVKRTWAGLRPGTPDELPILGPDPRVANLFHAAGGFRTGIVAAPLTGEVVAACVVGAAPPTPIDPFLPSRFPTTREAR